MRLAELIAGASSSRTCSLLLGQQERPEPCWRLALAQLSPYLLGHNVLLLKVKNPLFVSFYKAGKIRIPITRQYNNIYVIIEKFMRWVMLALLYPTAILLQCDNVILFKVKNRLFISFNDAWWDQNVNYNTIEEHLCDFLNSL